MDTVGTWIGDFQNAIDAFCLVGRDSSLQVWSLSVSFGSSSPKSFHIRLLQLDMSHLERAIQMIAYQSMGFLSLPQVVLSSFIIGFIYMVSWTCVS